MRLGPILRHVQTANTCITLPSLIPAFASLLEPYIHMTHYLCARCRHLRFSLSEVAACTSVGCSTRRLGITSSSLHSDLVKLYPSFEPLETSSLKNCHLCSLIVAGLRSAARCLHFPSASNHGARFEGISLARGCVARKTVVVIEHMIAFWGQVRAIFQVTAVPRTRRTDTNSFEDVYGKSHRIILFRLIYIGETDKERDFVPGEVSTFRVYIALTDVGL
jgi:hypothetical protein